MSQRPNIVLILNGDMGYSDLGCYGGDVTTPHLDALAAGGLRYTQFYNTARCCPSRASLLTGLYPQQADVGHMRADDGLDGYLGDLSRHSVTIAEALKASGYATYMSGKWHVTRHLDGPEHNWPCQRGFDDFYGILIGAANYTSTPYEYLRISGTPEYNLVLEQQVQAVLSGQAEPQEALDVVAQRWAEITERLNTEEQQAAFQASLE